MPRRRRGRTEGLDFIDDVVDNAVDTIFDRATDFVERVRDGHRSGFTEEQLRQNFKCAGCHKTFAVDQMEMLHPSNGFGTCKNCFSFMWKAAREKISLFGKKAARAGAQRVSQGVPPAQPKPPAGKMPWEVLGVAQNATVEEIKVAYRKQAMMWHPDRVAPGAPSDERIRARDMFHEITRARDVMMSVRKPPKGD